MRTMTLKFNNIEYSKLAIAGLVVSLFTLISIYSYFINASVLNVVERKNIENAISTLGSNVSGLETEYFVKVDSVNIDLALSMGFKKIENTSFAVRKTMAKQLVTLNSF